MMVFALSSSGVAYQTNPIKGPQDALYEFFRSDVSILGNDKVVYDAFVEELQKDYDALAEFAPRSAAMYRRMISAPVTPETMEAWTIAMAPESVAGYLRADNRAALKEHFGGLKSAATLRPHFYQLLEKKWHSIVMDMEKSGLSVPSYEAYLANISSALTSRHSGVQPVRAMVKVGGRKRLMKVKSKTLMYWLQPRAWHNPDEVISALTEFKPGLISFRQVTGGKAQRVIFMIPLPVHITAWPFAERLLRLQSRKPQFSVTKETSNLLGNHNLSMHHSANPDTVQEGNDFSGYDLSEKNVNTTQPMIAGVERALMELYGDTPYGPWDSVAQFTTAPWHATTLPNFMLDSPKMDLREDDMVITVTSWDGKAFVRRGKMFTTDQLNSGESDTIGRNNVNNEANREDSLAALREDPFIGDIMDPIQDMFMGDDTIGFWSIRDPTRWTSSNYRKIRTLMSDVAKSNGLELNVLKSNMRRFYSEYLKKMFIYGHYIPRLCTLMLFCSERNQYDQDPVTSARNFNAKLLEATPRGLTGSYSILAGAYYFMLKKDLLIRDPPGEIFPKMVVIDTEYRTEAQEARGSRRYRYPLPFSMYFLDKASGGVGVMPGTIPGASVDPLIVAFTTGKLRENLNSIAARLRQHRATKLFHGEDIGVRDVEGLAEGVKQGRDALDQKRIENSKLALTELVRRGLAKPNESLRYDNAPWLSAEQATQDLGKSPEFQVDDKYRMAAALESTLQSTPDLLDYGEYAWLRGLRVRLGGVVPYSSGSSHPHHGAHKLIAGLDPKLCDLGARIGYGSRLASNRDSIARVYRPLQNDPFFPKFDVEVLTRKLATLPGLEERTLWLVMMGAKQDDARNVSLAVDSIIDQVAFFSEAQLSSEADQWSGLLDQSRNNTRRYLEIADDVFPRIHSTLIALGNLWARNWSYNKPLCHITFIITPEYGVHLSSLQMKSMWDYESIVAGLRPPVRDLH